MACVHGYDGFCKTCEIDKEFAAIGQGRYPKSDRSRFRETNEERQVRIERQRQKRGKF